MTETISPHVIQEKMDQISGTLNAILSGGGEGYLRELQGLLHKNLAAAAIVSDMDAEAQPLARKHRLLRETQARFEERIRLAKPNGRKPSADWCKNEIFLAA